MKTLYLTYCSAGKRPGVHPPERLYISDRITRFINRCRGVNVDWAILSALYGFVFPEEEKEDYNVTFRTDKNYWLNIAVFRDQQKLPYLQSKEHIVQVMEMLRERANEHSIDSIIFYGPSPKMMKCYLEVLHYAFDECSKPHSWIDLIVHVRNKSETIKVIHQIENIR